jgi:hypothetical protein
MDNADFTILTVHGDLLTIENIAHILKKNIECNPAYLIPFEINKISIEKDKTKLSVEVDGFESLTQMDVLPTNSQIRELKFTWEKDETLQFIVGNMSMAILLSHIFSVGKMFLFQAVDNVTNKIF